MFARLRYELFIYLFSFYHSILNNCLSTSFIIFFRSFGFRIQIYFVLDISFEEVRKKIPSKIDSNTRWIKVWPFFFPILHFIFYPIILLLFNCSSLCFTFFFFIISYSLFFFCFLFLCYEPRIMKKKMANLK